MYRFDVEDGIVFRGRLVRVDNPDAWSGYWDGDGNVAFYDEGFRGLRTVEGADPETTEAAMVLKKHDMLGDDFMVVHLDRGTDLYVHAPEHVDRTAWRDEIEAVWTGDTWAIEVEEFDGRGDWEPSDSEGYDLNGLVIAEAEFAKRFPLTEFPAELFV